MTETSEDQISNLLKRKSILKGQLTRFETFLNSDKVSDLTQLEIRLKKIETSFEEFDSIQTNLELLDDSEEITRHDLEDRFFEIIAKAKRLLIIDTEQNLSNSAHNQFSNLNTNLNNLSLDHTNNLKLPSIRLPIFAGDNQSWPTFHDTFKQLIHDNPKLTNIEKLHHLKTCLKDVALKIIANLQTTDDNYDIAWNLLIERFENKRIMINDHINSIMNLSKLHKPSPRYLRELTDSIHTHVCALEKLGLDSKAWEWVLIYIITSKLDQVTNLAWEETLEPGDMPTYDCIKKFLTKRCFALENSSTNSSHSLSKNLQSHHYKNSSNSHTCSKSIATLALTDNRNVIVCPYCKQEHFIYRCPQFLTLSIEKRYNFIKTNKMCTNCLRLGHKKHDCRSSNCRICNKNHNTLLHNYDNKNCNTNSSKYAGSVSAQNDNNQHILTQSNSVPTFAQNSAMETHENQFSNSLSRVQEVSGNISLNTYHETFQGNTGSKQVFLPTATVLITDHVGNFHECTALLDSGSQSNIITEALCKRLNLDLTDFCLPIGGISQRITHIKHKTNTTVKSRLNNFEINLQFLVLPVITADLPSYYFPKSILQYPKHLKLADENFNIRKPVDILLGAEIFYDLLCDKRYYLGKNMPVLHETKFGWIFTGTIELHHGKRKKQSNQTICNLSMELPNDTLNQTLQKFWEVEELPKIKLLSPEAEFAENYFSKTTTRDSNGKFIVKLPFSKYLPDYGDSFGIAKKRLQFLENKFSKNESLKNDYVNFMKEYETLGHMSCLNSNDINNLCEQPSYVLPHHAVVKQSSTTTKCRVVFDASSRTNMNVSLNDNLLTGYTVQNDLFSIVMRLRLRKYVLSADIKMMFRQIWVHPDDRRYQMIVWRYNNNSNTSLYTLNTVTYGTACAPFLATRVLFELASQYEKEYTRTCSIIKNSFYMDDLLVSLDSLEEAYEVYNELNNILGSAGFYLRKWCSNSNQILTKILGTKNNTDNLIEFRDNKELKTLGLAWKPDIDTLSYSINLDINSKIATKRIILATISKIFDPLGLIGPTVIRAKLFMQLLWKQSVEWDEPISDELHEWWLQYLAQLVHINDLTISRQVLCDKPSNIQIHGFCDASERAYGTCIYLVSSDTHGTKHSRLLCAKSKVAPQAKCTLPRLELLAAVLLARLTFIVQNTLNIKISNVIYYTDSTIVLSWLQIDPSKLKTFVANRVAKIIELSNVQNWRHVSSSLNAADVISRGVTPQELRALKIWWQGPNFLEENLQFDSKGLELDLNFNDDLLEIKKTTISLTITEGNKFDLINKFSRFTKLLHVIAYCFRFKQRTLNKQIFESISLTPDEIQFTCNFLIKIAQSESFIEEIRALQVKKPLKSTSKILCLNPFLDELNILRVGGRLRNSQLNYSQKYPIILPKKHMLTRLIIMHEHIKNFHAGSQNLLAIVRLQYWPIDGKSTVKSVIRSCVKCFRANPKATNFLMGDLPGARVNPSRAFSHCGLDYCGPILIKDGTLKIQKVVKAYICIFVCLTVRAVHIELVKDLTTDSFLNSLKRFIARRGKPYVIYSDNGTNFVGARNHLSQLHDLFLNNTHNERVSSFLSSDKISWQMIPSRSPHMGGLWESAIKSMKYHFKRIVGNASVTYEEMYTVLTQIEAILNSRPLSPISDDTRDFLPLTPAHFLIGDSLMALPQENVQDIKMNRLSRYHRIQQLIQHFWFRWSREYLTTLQGRNKWKINLHHPKIGDLVILVEDHTPPLRWPMARVTALHAGKDNIVRVVSVKLPNGSVFQRSLSRVCILPTEDNC